MDFFNVDMDTVWIDVYHVRIFVPLGGNVLVSIWFRMVSTQIMIRVLCKDVFILRCLSNIPVFDRQYNFEVTHW